MEASILYPHKPKHPFFFEKQILRNTSKTHVWLKTDLIIVTGVFFTPYESRFDPKAPRNTSFVQNPSFSFSFSIFLSTQFWPDSQNPNLS